MILEVCWDALFTLSFGLSQLHGHGSWLVCEVALRFQKSMIKMDYTCRNQLSASTFLLQNYLKSYFKLCYILSGTFHDNATVMR